MKIWLFSILLFFSIDAFAKKAEIYTSFFSNVAVGGYDTVSYFSKNKPVKGNKKYQTKYNGVVWHFSNANNLKKFKVNPKKYAPQYGGYCAWAVAKNKTAKGDPLQWHIYNNKLYLNYDKRIKDKWLVNKKEFIKKANKNFPSVLDSY
ncbi:MAG: YHS domain-containing protein [Bdellovibrionaceae bacterium]|nr:YHS domain-containing protein [Pseudobdellovibrionaceae bacterium]